MQEKSPGDRNIAKARSRTGHLLMGVAAALVLVVAGGELSARYISDFGLDDISERDRYYETLQVGKRIIRNHRGLEGRFAGVDIRINGRSFRGPQIKTKKKAGFYRILLLGDEKTFGWGVAEEKTYAHRLQKTFDDHFIGKFEVINAGVPGYDLEMTAKYLDRYCLRFNPDVICILIGADDVVGRMAPPEQKNPFESGLLKHSYLGRLAWCTLAYQRSKTPDPRVATKAKESFRFIEKTAFSSTIELIYVFWSPSDDELRPLAAAALPSIDGLLHAHIVDSAPVLATLPPRKVRRGLLGDYPSEEAHALLAQLHVAAISIKARNFIFTLRDGRSISRNLPLIAPER